MGGSAVFNMNEGVETERSGKDMAKDTYPNTDAEQGNSQIKDTAKDKLRVKNASEVACTAKDTAWSIVVRGFWIFVICSVLGLVIEEVYHLAVFHEIQGRQGLLFGPFSPLYGVGGLVMATLAHFVEKRPLPVTFLLFAVTGGVLEFAVSWLLQSLFGIISWDYTGTWLSIDGRTNGFYMTLWGLLGIALVKLLLPFAQARLFPLIRRIPRVVNIIAIAFMVVNSALTIVSFNCWFHRSAGEPVATPTQQFFSVYFDDSFMEDRFEVMSLFPQDAKR